MTDVVVCPIVEGHGEYNSARPLIQRIWAEVVGGSHAEVLRPIRVSRGKLVIDEELHKATELAVGKLVDHHLTDVPKLVLLLIDGEGEPACILGPRLLGIVRGSARSGVECTCVIANKMYETWFAAAAASLDSFLDLSGDPELPSDPERDGLGKAWIKQRIRAAKYSETVDQPAMTSVMDLRTCRQRSPSFDKLCRELERLHLGSTPASESDGGRSEPI
jgi:hypothetical protein